MQNDDSTSETIGRLNNTGRATEDELRLALSLLQSSLESYKDVLIFSIGLNYEYLNFNTAFKEATFYAYGTEVKAGNSMLDSITNAEDRAKAKLNCDRALAGESHSTVEVYGDLAKSYFETKYNPVRNEQDEITGVTVLSANITERKMTEERITALNKELEAFSYSVAHDLRAPLRAIDGYTGILMQEHAEKFDAECQRLLNIISINARQMGRLIDDLLNFSKLGRATLNKEPVNIALLTEPIIIELVQAEGRANIEFKLGELAYLNCDETLMKQVFTNLIANAIKYSRKKEVPVIEIGSLKKETEITYYVKDNGAGFDMKYADKLFGVFNRLHHASEFEGTGVGLAIVKRIIDQHDGKIWAEAEEGKGAAFYFSLPI